MKRFPTGRYGRQRLCFFPAPFRSPLRSFAALLFAWDGDRVLIANIKDRGWCIPSGRVEPMETSIEAVQRESMEEAGATLKGIRYFGCYQITEQKDVRWADCFVAEVVSLGEIGIPTESTEARLARLDELPAIYHLWNPLTEMVFEYSKEVLGRKLK